MECAWHAVLQLSDNHIMPSAWHVRCIAGLHAATVRTLRLYTVSTAAARNAPVDRTAGQQQREQVEGQVGQQQGVLAQQGPNASQQQLGLPC